MAVQCAGQGEQVFRYVEGVLPPGERERFREHLQSCPACRRLQADFLRVAERARLLPQTDAPWKEFLPASGRLPIALRLRLPRRWKLGLAAGLLALALVAWYAPPRLTAPKVASVAPLDGARGLRPGSSLRITFSKDMNQESVLQALRLEPQASLISTWEGRTLRLVLPAQVQWGTDYKLTVGPAAKDRYGRSLGVAKEIHFTTAPPPDRLVAEQSVPWTPDELTKVQAAVDAGTYDYRATPQRAAERDLLWLVTPDKRAQYGDPVVKEVQLTRAVVTLPRKAGGGRLELVLERLAGKGENDPWFTTSMAEYEPGTN